MQDQSEGKLFTLLNDTKKDLTKQIAIQYLWIENLNIVKMPILPNQFISSINLQSKKLWLIYHNESKTYQEKGLRIILKIY